MEQDSRTRSRITQTSQTDEKSQKAGRARERNAVERACALPTFRRPRPDRTKCHQCGAATYGTSAVVDNLFSAIVHTTNAPSAPRATTVKRTRTHARARLHAHTYILHAHITSRTYGAPHGRGRQSATENRFTFYAHAHAPADGRRQSAGVLVAARQSSTDVISRTADNEGNRRRRQRWLVRCRSHSRFLSSSADCDKQ